MGDSAAAAGTTPSCTRTPLCSARLTPDEEELLTPRKETALCGTVRDRATEATSNACTEGPVKALPCPREAPEKTTERSSTCKARVCIYVRARGHKVHLGKVVFMRYKTIESFEVAASRRHDTHRASRGGCD